MIFGTRPEAVKMAPLALTLGASPRIRLILGVTAQHREMLDQVLGIFRLRPEYDLDIMTERQTLAEITCRTLRGLDPILERESPDLVLVQGDTTSAMAAALAAFYHQIPVGHVEAGLRTWEKYFPYPEEINRRLAGVLADLHFAPTGDNRRNLACEGVPEERIYVTGNTGLDALAYTVRPDYVFHNPSFRGLSFEGAFGGSRVLLVEVHRRESWGAGLAGIAAALREILDAEPDLRILFPVHPNPVVREAVFPVLSDHPRVLLTDPLSTDDFHNALARSHLVLTDSGGLQEEAPALGVPVLVARDVTERPEAVAAGGVKVVGTARESVLEETLRVLRDPEIHRRMAGAGSPYGDGRASERTARAILHFFGLGERPADWDPRREGPALLPAARVRQDQHPKPGV
ncbi:MAG: UDP-N-acetylglucosamine 2-epimerase (non-hydrolyzing) [Firmicutes bacterium]|nr:UDP-N-acetylglucosamine 2-epimerase (non-hydrolyzing) [Bacillota bacterium]